MKTIDPVAFSLSRRVAAEWLGTALLLATVVGSGIMGERLSGGIPGHKGSGGRPPDVIRKRCCESFDKRIPILEQIADDKLHEDSEQPRVRDRIMAIDQLARVGLGGDTKFIAAQADTPEGYTFTLVLGERGQS